MLKLNKIYDYVTVIFFYYYLFSVLWDFLIYLFLPGQMSILPSSWEISLLECDVSKLIWREYIIAFRVIKGFCSVTLWQSNINISGKTKPNGNYVFCKICSKHPATVKWFIIQQCSAEILIIICYTFFL